MLELFTSLKVKPWEQVTPEYARRSLVGEKCMVMWERMAAGAYAKPHHHPNEQMFWVLTGSMVLRIGSETKVIGPGDLARVPPDVEHDARFDVDTEFVSFQAPPRTDHLPGAPPPDHLQ